MAHLLRCDRCADEVRDGKGKLVKILPIPSLNNDGGSFLGPIGFGTELCDRCVRALEYWLKPIPAPSQQNNEAKHE
jgi:hypothetical protein